MARKKLLKLSLFLGDASPAPALGPHAVIPFPVIILSKSLGLSGAGSVEYAPSLEAAQRGGGGPVVPLRCLPAVRVPGAGCRMPGLQSTLASTGGAGRAPPQFAGWPCRLRCRAATMRCLLALGLLLVTLSLSNGEPQGGCRLAGWRCLCGTVMEGVWEV